MTEHVTTPLVLIENVKKSFVHEGRHVPILKGIDLRIEAGEMLCIVGPSGAGKSTLLHMLGTLDLPSEGNIYFEGDNVTAYSSAKLAEFRNRRIGFVFQFHHLLPEFTALENVTMPGRIRRVVWRRAATRCAGACADHESKASARRRAHRQSRHAYRYGDA
jgi:lipoprotein-releasing system ATP-binding protein